MADHDIDKACAELKIPRETYLTIIDRAIEQTQQDLEVLGQALDGNDPGTVQLISHRIKGDYANLRIPDISAAAKAVNDRIRSEGAVSDDLRIEYDTLTTLFSSFQAFLSR